MSAVLGMMGQASGRSTERGIWHRVCLNTIVRKGVTLDSERLQILSMGAKVLVLEQKERRVRISKPVGGWCSLYSSNGDTILSPLSNKSEPEDVVKASQEVGNKLDEMRQQGMQQIEGLIQYATHNDNVQVKALAQQLQDLKKQVTQAQQTKMDQEKALIEMQSENQQNQGEIEALRSEYMTAQQSANSLENEMNKILAQIGQNVGDDSQFQTLVNQHETTESQIYSLEQDLRSKQQLAERMKQEIQKLNQRLQNNFFQVGSSSAPNKKAQYTYRPGDVIQTNKYSPLGKEILIIKYYGNPDRNELTCPENMRQDIENSPYLLGVERDAPYDGLTHSGDDIFDAKPGCGLWITPEMVKGVLTPKALLTQLANFFEFTCTRWFYARMI